jgi:hypothetical protein
MIFFCCRWLTSWSRLLARGQQLCTMLFPARGQAISNSCGVWQQVHRLHDHILADVLRASDQPLATKFEHAPQACQAAVGTSARDVHGELSGLK